MKFVRTHPNGNGSGITLGFLRFVLFKWSTDQVDPADRFDHWREVRAKGLFGVTAELEPEQRQHFRGEFALQPIGNAGLVEIRASPYCVERTSADVANAPSDSLCIYQQLSQGCWFDTQGEDFTVQRGAFATSYSDLKYRTAPTGTDGFRLRILKIPLAEIGLFRNDAHDLVAKPFDDGLAIGPLLQSCFADLTDAAGSQEAPEAARLVDALAHLALIGRGVLPYGSKAAIPALRVGRLSAARRLIAGHLSNPNLSPTFVADRLGVSVRHVHELFETTGKSFSQTVTALRLEVSRGLLISAPQRSISDVAFACGFESLATFYRAFRAAQGIAPGDFRAQQLAGS
jgi:AraC-like DNA-binding protein